MNPLLTRGDYVWYVFVLASMLLGVIASRVPGFWFVVFTGAVAVPIAIDVGRRVLMRRRAEDRAVAHAYMADREEPQRELGQPLPAHRPAAKKAPSWTRR